MSGELINTLLILGAGQGLFLALILATKGANTTANRVLAVAMVGFSLFVVTDVYYQRGWYERWPHFIGVSVPLTYLFAPICYLYAKMVSTDQHGVTRRDLLHFIPFALVVAWYTPFYLSDGAAKVDFVHRLNTGWTPLHLTIVSSLQYPLGVFYVVLTLRLLKRHRAQVKETFSSVERISLDWLQYLTLGVAGVWGVALVILFLMLAGIDLPTHESFVPLALSILIYAIGYQALRQPEILQPRDLPPRDPTAETPLPGYEKSGLSAEQAGTILDAVRQVMTTQQLYLRSTLTLQELAEAAGLSSHNVSEAINTQGGTNFYTFVNGYRVEEVKRRLKDPKYANLTILGVAADSGFNSKSVFNAFFKEATGMTPSQYRSGRAT